MVFLVATYHKVSAQEALQETSFATSSYSKHMTAKYIPLRLFLLKVELLVTGH